jgi:hypothetical protein
MSDRRESLCDLIETRSARYGITRQKLWEWAFAAILKDSLVPDSSDDVIPYPDDPAQRRHAIAIALPAIEQRGADPSKWYWARRMAFAPRVFDKWLNETLQKQQFPANQTRRAGAKPTRREMVKEFLDDPAGPPAGATGKQIAEQFEKKIGQAVSERTVRRARGRK